MCACMVCIASESCWFWPDMTFCFFMPYCLLTICFLLFPSLNGGNFCLTWCNIRYWKTQNMGSLIGDGFISHSLSNSNIYFIDQFTYRSQRIHNFCLSLMFVFFYFGVVGGCACVSKCCMAMACKNCSSNLLVTVLAG